MKTGMLYVVATPIGNLEDITLRALRVLKESGRIFCEDTRVTRKLLSRYDIHIPCERLDAHTEETRAEKIVALLEAGEDVALVSDAGTPGISDPGARAVARVRRELPEAPIVAVAGASALTAALSVAGIPTNAFLFLGFPPHKKGRTAFFKRVLRAAAEHPVVFYESTHRICKALSALGEQPVVLAHELTKLHEETLSGSARALLAELNADSKKQKGEFVVIVERNKK